MIIEIIKNRRAVRKFTAGSVSDDEIKNLIEAFQTSPCGMHQPDVMNLVVV
jgi:nitroreductase